MLHQVLLSFWVPLWGANGVHVLVILKYIPLSIAPSHDSLQVNEGIGGVRGCEEEGGREFFDLTSIRQIVPIPLYVQCNHS